LREGGCIVAAIATMSDARHRTMEQLIEVRRLLVMLREALGGSLAQSRTTHLAT
jgi:hypothetical protein